MTDYEMKIGTYFNLKLEGKICEKCWVRFVNNYKIDNLLKLKEKAEGNVQSAKDITNYIKEEVIKIDPTRAKALFPEIDLK